MRHFLKPGARAAAVALLLAAGGALGADSDVIANIGPLPITAAELKDYLPPLTPAQRTRAENDPTFMSDVVRGSIGRKLLLDEALKQSWDKQPAIAVALKQARDDLIINSYLQSVSLPSPDWPSEADIRKAYDANRDKFTIPRQYHLAQIFIAAPANATKSVADAAERNARELARRAKARGADFAALARASSQDAVTAGRGGDLGWVAETQLVPPIRTAVAALHGDGIVGPIHAMGGWHIIEVLGTAPPVHPPLAQVRGAIIKLLRDGRANAYITRLLDEKHVTVNETAAEALLANDK